MRVRITLRQKPQQCAHSLDAIDGRRGFHQLSGTQLKRLNPILAKMIIKTGTPRDIDTITRLEHRLHGSGPSAAHKAEVTTTGARHNLRYDARLAMALDAKNDCLVLPLHENLAQRLNANGTDRRVVKPL